MIQKIQNLLYQLNSKFKFNFKLDNLKRFRKFKKIVIIGMEDQFLAEAIYNFYIIKLIEK